MEEDIKLGKDIQEFEEIFGNIPIKDLEKIREYIKRDYIPKLALQELLDIDEIGVVHCRLKRFLEGDK